MNQVIKKSGTSKSQIWNDVLISKYYQSYFDNLNSKELDKEFLTNVKSLSKALVKLDSNEQEVFIGLFAKCIEFYVENKFNKEIESTFDKIVKF